MRAAVTADSITVVITMTVAALGRGERKHTEFCALRTPGEPVSGVPWFRRQPQYLPFFPITDSLERLQILSGTNGAGLPDGSPAADITQTVPVHEIKSSCLSLKNEVAGLPTIFF